MSTRLDCSLVVNAGLADSDVICKTLPHLLRTHRGQFGEVLLVVDGRPPTGRYAQSVVASTESIRSAASSCDNVRVIGVDRSAASRAEINRVWFGRSRVADRCFAGSPIFAYVFGLHHARMPYRIHMDCDMLVHDPGPQSWAEKGVELLQANPDVMFVNPMMGPSGAVHEFRVAIDETRGLRLAHSFSSRCFMYDAAALTRQFLPLRLEHWGPFRAAWCWLHGRSSLLPFEHMVAHQLERQALWRCELPDEDGFTIHGWSKTFFTQDRIDNVIRSVEAGSTPPGQKGYTNLMDLW
jgi:hypothetical protein